MKVTETARNVSVRGAQAGIGGIEADCAAGRVLAIQGSLRSAQDFDPSQVIDLQGLNSANALVHLIDIHRDGAALVFTEILSSDAAQGECWLRLRPVRRVEQHVRHAADDVASLSDDAIGEIGGGHRSDRDRHILQTLRRALRCDDDLAELIFRQRRCGDVARGDCGGQCQQRGRLKQICAGMEHGWSPGWIDAAGPLSPDGDSSKCDPLAPGGILLYR